MDNNLSFVPFFKGDSSQRSPEGDALMELAGKYGGALTKVNPIPKERRSPGSYGYMPFSDTENVYIDPTQAGLFTAAHEITHSAFPTKIGLDDMYLKMKGPEEALKVLRESKVNEAIGPAQLRYLYETQSIPTMIEEASAQGGAQGMMKKLGYGNLDQGSLAPGHFNVQRTLDGQIDSLAYPLSYKDIGINTFMQANNVGAGMSEFSDGSGMFQGVPLGIGVDPRFTPAEREEYYRIQENARPRLERTFNKVYNKFQ